MPRYTVKTFYSFTPQNESELLSKKEALLNLAAKNQVFGLVILGEEGFNTTLSCLSESSLDLFIENLRQVLQISEISKVKISYSQKKPFKRFDIKIRPEIVTLNRENYRPQMSHFHLSPEEWESLIENEDVVIVDTRNSYEVKVGKFRQAIDLNIEEFTEFPDKIKRLKTNKDKTHLIYCTGGIRCEKAIFEMEAQGFHKVFQLEGGILNYLEKFPNKNYQGECFVFDSRVALDQNLNPSERYSLCPHCGDTSEIDITCLKCDSPAKLCPKCSQKSLEHKDLTTCSKNCRHHYKLRPDKKAAQQKLFFHES